MRDPDRLSLWEQVSTIPLRLGLYIRRARYSAHPFDSWSSSCPACGSTYDDHEATYLGGHPVPAEEFISAVQNHDWRRAHDLGNSGEPLGRSDVVLAPILRCPRPDRLIVFLSLDRYGLSRASLVSQQILTPRLAGSLVPLLEGFRPAVHDVLHGVVGMRRRARQLERGSSA